MALERRSAWIYFLCALIGPFRLIFTWTKLLGSKSIYDPSSGPATYISWAPAGTMVVPAGPGSVDIKSMRLAFTPNQTQTKTEFSVSTSLDGSLKERNILVMVTAE